MSDFAKDLNDALATVVATRKALDDQQNLVAKAAEAHNAAVSKATELRDKVNAQVNEALAAAGISKADSRVTQSN